MNARRPSLTVAAPWARMRRRRTTIAPGQRLRIGRSERADFMVPCDDAMAGVHFSVEWRESSWWLTHRSQNHVTLHNGQPCELAPLTHGDWVRAGHTDFTIHCIEEPREFADNRDRGACAQRDAHVLNALRQVQRPLYAVLDAARDIRILDLLESAPNRYASLYEGWRGDVMRDVAPYLVKLDDSNLLQHLVHQGWGRAWGIYVATTAPFRRLRMHLRRFLIVEDETTGDPLYFRFYDPRVLGTFLTASTVTERNSFVADHEYLYADEAGCLWSQSHVSSE